MNADNRNKLLTRIEVKPEMMGGRPTIRGMRFPVSDVLELLASGMTFQEILDQHPLLEIDDIQAALLYASYRIKNTLIINAA